MRLMSFSLTAQQLRDGSKDVTRRLGWAFARPGMQVRPVLKAMGLKRGEHVVDLRAPITFVSVRGEALRRMTDDQAYGEVEVRREGFPNLTPRQFVEMFCDTHRGCAPGTVITRIEFTP